MDDLGTVLMIWAHPDDETYLAGGLSAALTDAGKVETQLRQVSQTGGLVETVGLARFRARVAAETLAEPRTR
jgi:LmbE family N-acetylglucosaminyl deacetylase